MRDCSVGVWRCLCAAEGQRSHADVLMLELLLVCRDSEISSSVSAMKARTRDYDTGLESGDDLEEHDFSM